MVHTLPRLRFSIRQLALATLVYAFLFGILVTLPVSVVQIVASSSVVMLFVLADFLFGHREATPAPILAQAANVIARYATSLAVAMAVCSVWYVIVGTVVTRAADGFTSLLISPIGFFAALSTIAFVAALAAMHYYQSSVVYLFLNAPGVSMFGFMTYAAWHIGCLAG